MAEQPKGYNDALLEIAQHLALLSASTIRLHAGEMTAGEMRAVRAVLHWQARELLQRATGSDDLPRTVTATVVDGMDYRAPSTDELWIACCTVEAAHEPEQLAVAEAALKYWGMTYEDGIRELILRGILKDD